MKGQETKISIPDYNNQDNSNPFSSLIYHIPKMLLDLPLDTTPTNALRLAQRQFFKAIYALVCDNETGPRIPTLFLSLGQDKVKSLLSVQD